jgi:hypothetical protein
MKKKRKKNIFFFLIENFLLSEQLVDQVLNELNINMANQIPGKSREFEEKNNRLIFLLVAGNGLAAGAVANPAHGKQAVSTADADLEARLDALRRN